jgi:hypothetical protein
MYAGVQLLPEHVFSLPGDPDVSSAVFSHDGASVWALTNDVTFHFGSLLDRILPFALGVTCLIIVFSAIRRMIAAVRTPREVGRQYCPSCNYCVSHEGGTLATCPECGTDLSRRKPIAGQSTRRRVIRTAVTMVLPAILMWGGTVVLVGHMGVFSKLNWHSPTLGKKLDDSQNVTWWVWGLGFHQTLYRCDLANGQITRVADFPGATFNEMGVHPATGDVYLQATGDQLTVISPASGRVDMRLKRDRYNITSRGTPLALDHDQTTGEVYISWEPWTPALRRSVLAVWSAESRDTRVVADNAPTEGAPTNTEVRRFITKGDATRRYVFALPSYTEVTASKRYLLHVYATSMATNTFQHAHAIDLGTAIRPMQAGIINLRDDVLILATANQAAGSGPEELRAFDLDALMRGEARIKWSIPVNRSPNALIAQSPDESTLFARTEQGIAEIPIADRGIQRFLSPGERDFMPQSVQSSRTHVLVRNLRPLDRPPGQQTAGAATEDIIVWRVR